MKLPLRATSRTAKILRAIYEGFEEDVMFGFHPGRTTQFGYHGAKAIREAKFRRLNRQALLRLKESRFIRQKKDGDRITFSLTAKGNLEYIRLQVLDAELFGDGRVCIVVFDIPEQQRSARRALRRLLRVAGFVQFQKSVWISPVNVALPLRNFVWKIGIGRWVRVFVADEMLVSQPVRSVPF